MQGRAILVCNSNVGFLVTVSWDMQLLLEYLIIIMMVVQAKLRI